MFDFPQQIITKNYFHCKFTFKVFQNLNMDFKNYFNKAFLLKLVIMQPMYYHNIPIRLQNPDRNPQVVTFLPQTDKNITRLNYKSNLCNFLAGVQLCQCLFKSNKIYCSHK